jgi:hypothetical protein
MGITAQRADHGDGQRGPSGEDRGDGEGEDDSDAHRQAAQRPQALRPAQRDHQHDEADGQDKHRRAALEVHRAVRALARSRRASGHLVAAQGHIIAHLR